METTINSMTAIFQETCNTLLTIWNELGHDNLVINERSEMVIQHTKTFLSELIAESENERTEILDECEMALKKIKSLRDRLRITEVMEGYMDTPYVVLLAQFKELIEKYETEIKTKTEMINKLLQDEAVSCRKLGVLPKKIQTKPKLPTPEEIKEFEKYVERMNQQVFELEEQFVQIKCDITQMLDDLGRQPFTDFEHEVVKADDSLFVLSIENMAKLKQWQNNLKLEIQERQADINELRQKLLSLWELLEEDPEYRTRFTSEIQGIGDNTIHKLKHEILRCNEKKKAHIKEYVDKIRSEIKIWWEKCMYGTRQRSDFIALFKSECYTDDLLMLHELQVEKLKLYYENNKKIFDLIKKRDQLWQRFAYLSECANKKDRFKNRGGELLKEEKERKEVNIQLPNIEKQLLAEVKVFKELNHHEFLVNDESLEMMIHEKMNHFKEEKNAKLSAKKKQRDITMTPSKNGRSILTTTPSTLTASKRKAQPLKPANSLSTVPSKRSRAFPEEIPATKRSKTVEKQPKPSASTYTGTIPKIRKNDVTVGKVSYCVRRRLCPTKRLSKESINSSRNRKKIQQSHTSTESSDEFYNQFMVGISSRSSTVQHNKENRPGKTPQKTPSKSPRTPRLTSRTPASPRTTHRLQVASPLPLLF